jgi:hypothetical protein
MLYTFFNFAGIKFQAECNCLTARRLECCSVTALACTQHGMMCNHIWPYLISTFVIQISGTCEVVSKLYKWLTECCVVIHVREVIKKFSASPRKHCRTKMILVLFLNILSPDFNTLKSTNAQAFQFLPGRRVYLEPATVLQQHG